MSQSTVEVTSPFSPPNAKYKFLKKNALYKASFKEILLGAAFPEEGISYAKASFRREWYNFLTSPCFSCLWNLLEVKEVGINKNGLSDPDYINKVFKMNQTLRDVETFHGEGMTSIYSINIHFGNPLLIVF